MAQRCATPPRTVTVSGHWRTLSGRRRRRAAAARKPPASYWVAEDSTGRTCGHHHRTARAAVACARRQQRRESVNRARYLTRKQARKTRVRRWQAAHRGK